MSNLKNILIYIFTTCYLIIPVSAQVIQAGVSVDIVPKELYGTWRINAKQDTTNSPRTFRPQSVDSWILTRKGDYVTLENPMSGAKSTVCIKNVEGNLICFSRKDSYDNNKVLTDVVTIRLEDNKFHGINSLTLETYSLVDGHLLKSENATYRITGEKIYGDNILK